MRSIVRFGIWLPVAAVVLAISLFVAADYAIERPGGESSINYTFFAVALILGAAAIVAMVIVLASSLWALWLVRRGPVSRLDLVSSVIGLVVSAGVLALLTFQQIDSFKREVARKEHAAMWRAIEESDHRSLSDLLANPRGLQLDSNTAYSLLFGAIKNKRMDMAAALVKAGMPLLEGDNAHPEVIRQFQARQHSRDMQALTAELLTVASLAGKPQIEMLHAALDRAVKDESGQRLQRGRDLATVDSMAYEIENDPKFGFAASISPEALRAAATEGRFPSIDTRNRNGETLLFFALRDAKQCALVPEFLRSTLDVHQANDFGVTPLMLAAGNCENDVVDILLKRQVDVQAASRDGSTALMYASVAGQSENVRRILSAGGKVNRRTKDGETALSMARQQRFEEVVKLLEQAGGR